jgi:hypothetical protein
MKKRIFSLLLLLVLQIGFSQNNLLWKGYFSYNEIKAISSSPTTIYAASENALFSSNTVNNQIKTTTTVDGLSGQTISALYYSSTFNKSIVGYENGLFIVINEADGSLLNVTDVINKQLPANVKKINDFMEFDGIIYISCDFGIVQFNLQTMLFGDTYFIGDNGAEIKITQTAVYNGYIYAASNAGIRRAVVTNKNLNDFNQWETVTSGSWSGITPFGSTLIASSLSTLNKYDDASNSFSSFSSLANPILNSSATGNYLVVSSANAIHVYDTQLVLQRQLASSAIAIVNLEFSCATIVDDLLYVGTKANGLFAAVFSNPTTFNPLTPQGPARNNIFAIQSTNTAVWAVYGDYDVSYNPYDLDSYGISKFTDSGWLNIPYENILDAKSLCRVTVNPNNENEVYVSSFFSGLLKVENDVPSLLYNQTNSGLESLTFVGPDYVDVRINGTAFDKSGNLWVTNSRIKNGLKVLRSSGDWQSFSMDKILDVAEDNSFGRMVIDKNGTKWMTTSRDGVIGFNENGTVFKKITLGSDLGNLPSSDARAVIVDNRNQLWIGTAKGLRIVPNIAAFQTEAQINSSSIIIKDDNLAQELLFEQFISDIAVDGANNKWIGTADSGVFLVSPNGQETKYHFTTSNSPLPSNAINDIDINSATAEVFIATDKGMVSFKGVATGASEDLANVFVYPNPVRPQYEGTVKVSGLLNKATIKITDITGNLVYETTSQGGTIEWDTTAFGKYKVASGVYMIFISAEDGIETKVKKVMIIR